MVIGVIGLGMMMGIAACGEDVGFALKLCLRIVGRCMVAIIGLMIGCRWNGILVGVVEVVVVG